MKNKIFKMAIVVLLFVWLLTITASALSFTATMKASNTTVAEATEFTITVSVSNLDVGTNGINSLNGYLKYDSKIFEPISESSIEGLNSWTAKFDESTGKIELTKTNFVQSAEEVLQITFITKSGVSGKSGTISYSNIVASNSESDISATDISTSITVGNSSDNTTNSVNNNSVINLIGTVNKTGNNTVNKTGNNTVNNSVNKVTNNTVNKTANNTINNSVSNYANTIVKEDIPNTGVNDTTLTLVFVAIIVAIAFYVKIEKINKDMK